MSGSVAGPTNSQLAINGGPRTRREPFSKRQTMFGEEVQAAQDVVKSGLLSGFQGAPTADFLGGPRVRQFEAAWAEKFAVTDAVSFNSWTSGLLAIMGAIDLEQ